MYTRAVQKVFAVLAEPHCHPAQPKRLTGCQFPCLIHPNVQGVLDALCPLLHWSVPVSPSTCQCSFKTTVTLNMAKARHKYLCHGNPICTFLNTEITAVMNRSL